MTAIADLLALGVIAAIALLILAENREDPIPVVHSSFLVPDQIPLVAPCITPPPGPRRIPERSA